MIGGLFNSLNIFKKVDSLRMNKVKTGKIKHSGILKTIAGLFALGKMIIPLLRHFVMMLSFVIVYSYQQFLQKQLCANGLMSLHEHRKSPGLFSSAMSKCSKKFLLSALKKQLTENIFRWILTCHRSTIQAQKKKVFLGLTKIMMVMLRYLPISELMAICSIANCVPVANTATKTRLSLSKPVWIWLKNLELTRKNILVRLDSAHDSVEIIEELLNRETTFEVTERTVDRRAQQLLIPDIEVNTFWTNLPDEAATVITLYHAHGTSEQYHSEVKTDLGFERMPSGKFATNSLLLLLAMLAFNALRIVGQSALKMKEALPRRFKVQRRRLRSVLQDLIYIACKRTRHSNSIFLKFGRYCPWFEVFRKLHSMYC